MKYRKKPGYIEAIRYNGFITDELINFTNNSIELEPIENIERRCRGLNNGYKNPDMQNYGKGFTSGSRGAQLNPIFFSKKPLAVLKTSRGEMLIKEGYYITKDENGKIDYCYQDFIGQDGSFLSIYEKVKE